MRYVLMLEAIGDNYSYHRRMYEKTSRPFTRREVDYYRLGNKSLSPWIARIISIKNGHLVREFLSGQKDYTFTNGLGSRGIYFYYALKPGVYEINERTGWTRARRYFAKVIDDKTLIEISEEELIECLSKRD